jgi:hypothetical protein
MTDERKEANRILDLLRLGWDVPEMTVIWALITTGDLLK